MCKLNLNQTTNKLIDMKAALNDAKAQLAKKDKQLHETLTLHG